MRRAVAALLVAAVIPLGAAKCGDSGSLPLKYKYAWLTELPAGEYVVFSPGKPDGDWELKGYVRGQPNVGVWVRSKP